MFLPDEDVFFIVSDGGSHVMFGLHEVVQSFDDQPRLEVDNVLLSTHQALQEGEYLKIVCIQTELEQNSAFESRK